ncbi:hypothetical protein XIS1_650025 [Xenorhabdus innexi]|uniref:Uncharacterized protein n=1 Tax=Xenorhabdus innexi TaxID=290109 RepID=A0A1N6N041_9GAMM|nr:hypothetical protein XIS1_650025 [Xenorhabdus innexi]
MARKMKTSMFQKSNIMNYFFTTYIQNNLENRFYDNSLYKNGSMTQ